MGGRALTFYYYTCEQSVQERVGLKGKYSPDVNSLGYTHSITKDRKQEDGILGRNERALRVSGVDLEKTSKHKREREPVEGTTVNADSEE